MVLLKRTDPVRTPSALARHLFQSYEGYRVASLSPATCQYEQVNAFIHRIVHTHPDLFSLSEAGKSLEGRRINLVSCGRGQKRILFWSQMHGDEYTATLALADLFNFIAKRYDAERWIGEMLEETTLHFIPMLNPDGAERRQRRTAQHIDMNRDALALATPEANILRVIQQKLKPDFGFNLHDQELATVGDTREVAALSLLVPPLDAKGTIPKGRLRAMRVAALIARVLAQFVPRSIASYPESFEPRAFGENMQRWGTSTVLVESGHWQDDPAKDFIRKLNVVALLTAARCIGNFSYQDVDLDHYRMLPQNSKHAYDYIIRDVVLEYDGTWAKKADIGLAVPPNSIADPPIVTIKDVGDLSTFTALAVIPGQGRRVASSAIVLEQAEALPLLLARLNIPYG